MTQFIVRKIILVLMIAVIYSCNLEKENKSTASKTQTLFTLLDAKETGIDFLNKVKNQKVVSLILGGPNKYYKFSNDQLVKIFDKIKSNFISKGYFVLVIPSMRTPQKIIDLAIAEFKSDAHVISSIDKKAYLSSLALATYIVVTCDSTSMISEASTSGKPIFVAHMKPKRNNYRFKKFFQLFKDMGVIKDLGETVESWKYNKFNEAERIAIQINKKIKN